MTDKSVVPIDWSQPIEAVHEDGRVVPVRLGGEKENPDKAGEHYTLPSLNGEVAGIWRPDGKSWMEADPGWRIRNVVSNPLSLETSDLDPITPEEDALATKAIVVMGWTRQAHHSAVRMVRVVRKEERARLLSRAQRDLGIMIRTLECNSDDVRTAEAIIRFVEQNA